MRRLQTKQIQGNEIVARDIYSINGVIVISAGTRLKPEYKEKLLDMRINSVFVEDEISKDIRIDDYTEESINELCSSKLKNTIECFASTGKNDAKDMIVLAEGVMNSVLEKKEVLYNVSEVRRKDQSLSDHFLNVAALSILTALHAGYTSEQTKDIAIGAILHDIGYLNIKVEYRNMLIDEVDEETAKEIRRHVVYGYVNVENKKWLRSVSKDIILYHHERMDGTGYPFKLKGDRIRPEVKLVAICDAFDNMIYGSLERRCKVYEAMEFITGNAGIKFDREYARIFASFIAAYPVGTIVKTNTGKTCIVIRQNNQAPTRPVLRILRQDETDELRPTDEEIDLIKELTVFVSDTIET